MALKDFASLKLQILIYVFPIKTSVHLSILPFKCCGTLGQFYPMHVTTGVSHL